MAALMCAAIVLVCGPRGGHAVPVPPPRGGEATPLTNVQIGEVEAARRGWRGAQFTCLYRLWTRESHWTTTAGPSPVEVEKRETTRAYGIPQALPGWKMLTAGPGWLLDPWTQIRWGLGYIAARYGTPCGAWLHSEAYSWY